MSVSRSILKIQQISKILKEEKLLNILSLIFSNKLNLLPCFGVEIEFFLSPNIPAFEFQNKLKIPLQKEKGGNQYEINLLPSFSLSNYAAQIEDTRNKIARIARDMGGKAIFTAKPFVNDYGNSMHFHLNFISANNQNTVIQTNNNQEDKNFIEYCAASLCNFVNKTILAFLNKEDDFLRLDKNFMAPTHIAYGTNNRTMLIRIPTSKPLRIEHRLPSANCDPYLIIFTILISILESFNIKEQKQVKKIYGNAFDSQYNLEVLPLSIKEANKNFEISLLQKYLTILRFFN